MPLSERDKQILAHIDRYHLSTRQVLHELFFPTQQINAVSKVTSKLRKQGYLNSYELWPPKSHYFVLGTKAATQLGYGMHRTKPLGDQALPRRYATLLYCCLNESKHKFLTPSEFATIFPGMSLEGHDDDFYAIETKDDQILLSLIRTDGNATVEHLKRTCVKDIQERKDNKAFAKLIAEGRFTYVLMTATEWKNTLIQQAFQKQHEKEKDSRRTAQSLFDNVHFRFAVLTDLELLSASRTK